MRWLTAFMHRRLPALPPGDWERPGPGPVGLRRDVIVTICFLVFALLNYELALSLTEQDKAPDRWSAYAVLTAMILPLMFRRRWPVIMMVVGSAAFMLGGTSPAFTVVMQLTAQIAYFLGLYSAVTWAKNRKALWTTLTVVLLSMTVWILLDLFTSDLLKQAGIELVKDPAGIVSPDIAFTLFTFTNNLLFFGGSIFLGLISWSNAYANEVVKSQSARIAEQAEQLADRAVNEERLRIARELHDVIAHHIASVGVQAAAARMVQPRDPEKASELMKGIESSARSAVGETRALLGVLRENNAAVLPEQASADSSRVPEPSMAILSSLISQNEAMGLAITVSRSEHAPGYIDGLAPGISLALYRICGEALANVRRHSTARRATLSLRSGIDDQGPWVEAEVTDEGSSRADSSGSGYGLRGIRERATLHHGLVEIGPRIPRGWRTRARLRVTTDSTTKVEA